MDDLESKSDHNLSSKNNDPFGTSTTKPTSNRWLIWVIAFVGVAIASLIGYTVVTNNEQASLTTGTHSTSDIAK